MKWSLVAALLVAAAIPLSGCGRTITINGSTARAMELRRETEKRAEYYDHIVEAEEALLVGDIDRAKAEYKTMTELYPKDPTAYRVLAQIDVHDGDLEGAVGWASKAYNLAPEDVDTAVLYGGLLAARGDIKGAGAVYRDILKVDPYNEEIPLLLSGLLVVNKEFDEARRVLDAMTARHPGSAMALFERARIELVNNDCDAAMPYLTQTLEADPRFARAEMAMGMCAEEADNDDEAIAHYEKALEMEPDNTVLRTHVVRMHVRGNRLEDAERENEKLKLFQLDDTDVRVNRGLILFYQAKFPEAITEFNLILAGDPQNAQALYFLALCLTRQNELERAYDAYARIPEDSGYFADALAARGALLRRMGRLDAAAQLMRDALEINPQDTYLMRTLALVVADQGHVDEAEGMLKKALALTPDDASLTYVLANIYERSGQWEKGVALMEEVLTREPDNADALNFVGYTLVDRGGDLEHAEQYLKRAVELRPTDGFISDSYGWLLYKRGKYTEALKHLEHAAALVPDEAVIAEHVGDCYKAMRKNAEAKEWYTRALGLHPEPQDKKDLEDKLRALP